MERNLVTMRYFETYYYANIINNVLTDPFEFLRHLNSWHEDSEESLFFTPFPKRSILHALAAHFIHLLVDEQVDDISVDAMVNDRTAELWVDQALRYHGFRTAGFRSWIAEQKVALADVTEDHIAEYHSELSLAGDLDDLVDQLTAEVFFVLFANRTLLEHLNSYVAGIVSLTSGQGVRGKQDGRLTTAGHLKRVRIPEWARNAVFFRDRGLCVQCLTNVSGLLTAQNDDNYDHIIPLAQGGINDVTNLQLLCGSCNRMKGGNRVDAPNRYESWY